MQNVPTTEACRREVRTQVCTECPYRSQAAMIGPDIPKPCEKDCPLFVNLRIVHEVARQASSGAGNRPHVLHDLVQRISSRWRADPRIMQNHVTRVVGVFENLFRA